MAENKGAPEVTVESLQALVDQLTAQQQADAQKLIEQADELAREAGDHQSTKANLANALESLTEAAGIIDGQKLTIAEQDKRIIDLQMKPAAFPVIEVGKVKYEVQGKGFKYNGVDYTVQQLLENKKLQKELVEKGMGFIVLKAEV